MTEHEGAQEGPRQRPVVGPVEPGEGRRAREDGDERRGSAEPAPLAGQGGLLRHPTPAESRPLPIGHESSQSIAKQAYFQIKTSDSGFDLPSMPCTVAGPCVPLRSPPSSSPRSRPSHRPRRGGAGPDGVPRPGRVRLRHARRAARSHGHHAGDRPAALRDPAPGPEARSSSRCRAARGSRPSRRPRRSRSRWTRRCAATAWRCSTSAGRASRASSSCPNLQRLRSLDAYHAAGGGQLRQPHRAAARLLHDGRHRARHRRAAPGAGRRQDRAHGDLLRHARRPAVRARLPRARRPADPRLDRRPRRPRRLPARHLPQHAARARRAVRARRLSQRDRRTRWPTWARSCARINASGPLRGDYYDADGRKRATQYSTPDELSFLLTAGDLNPFLQAALPAAISAARRGDTAPLMRLRRIGQGGPTRAEDLSVGLNAATGCTDVTLPFPRAAPVARSRGRRPAGARRRSRRPTTTRSTRRPCCARATSTTAWPGRTTRSAPPFTGPLPDVPALLLGGRLDTRTPLENARATAHELPHSTIVALKGSGHDALDSDITGCTAQALARFIDGRRGRPPVPGPRQRRAPRRRCRRTR